MLQLKGWLHRGEAPTCFARGAWFKTFPAEYLPDWTLLPQFL